MQTVTRGNVPNGNRKENPKLGKMTEYWPSTVSYSERKATQFTMTNIVLRWTSNPIATYILILFLNYKVVSLLIENDNSKNN